MADVRHWPGMRVEYATLGPHEGASTTGAHQVGVAFSAHRRVVQEYDGRTVEGDMVPGSAVVTGAQPLVWRRVREPTEALKIYPDPGLLRSVATRWGATPGELPLLAGVPDGVLLGIATVLRRDFLTGGGLSDIAGSTLAHRLVGHLLIRYHGLRPPARNGDPGLLGPSTVDRVVDFVESRLHAALSLDDLAAQARLSPYHFARSFKNTTGLTPYEFVTARRMDRARRLLTAGTTVAEAARRVGAENGTHFRRTFRRHVGVNPGALVRPGSGR